MYQFFLHFFIYCGLYNKPSYARVLISSHLWSIGGQTYRIYGTIILYRWYNNWAMTSCHINSYIDPSLKFIEQIDSKLPCIWEQEHQWHTRLRLMCHFFVLTTFWRPLWPITEQMHGNFESICSINFKLGSM